MQADVCVMSCLVVRLLLLFHCSSNRGLVRPVQMPECAHVRAFHTC